MSDWKPIETAPKNEGEVIIVSGVNGMHRGIAAWWYEPNEFEYDLKPHWQGILYAHMGIMRIGDPTHWMPVPQMQSGTEQDENCKKSEQV
jgi:hypothetical protein